MHTSPAIHRIRERLGGWLPRDEQALVAFRKRIAQHVATLPDKQLVPAVRELAALVHDDPLLRMPLSEAIQEAIDAGYELGYSDIDGLMKRINAVMSYAPPFDTTELVGCPINALLDWPMCMPSGFALFRSGRLNAQLGKVLQHWSAFLSSAESCTYLHASSAQGWFSPEADVYVHMRLFECDPRRPHWGFSSWNDFFTRRFKPGARPVAEPDNRRLAVSACEATPYNLQNGVSLQDRFWLKAQPYSLFDMFTPAHAELAKAFEHGTVYQAFLSAYNYHRWHAPVAGKVVHAYRVPGTYYSDVESAGLDAGGPNNSQGYITAVAARAVIVIDSGVPGVGLVACIFVGMAEISSCILEVQTGQTLAKGQEMGYFQFGGSTHCVIFQKDVVQSWIPIPPYNTSSTPIIELGSPLARLR